MLFLTAIPDCNAGSVSTPKLPPEVTAPAPNGTAGSTRTCLSGQTYTAAQGDTCHSIARVKSVAEHTLASINDLLADCSRLQFQIGTSLCLPKTCEIAELGATDDCWSISTSNNISFPQFLAYNPTINSDCSNLRPNGTVVCVSSPDGSYTPVARPGSNSSWTSGEYAENLVPAPGNTPFGTTANCGAYYRVQVADSCNRISLAAKVSVALFRDINPSINNECSNLTPNLWYCVHPTYDWNVSIPDGSSGGTTPSSTTVSPPAPTPIGTTGQCYKWHVVVNEDTCALLQSTLGVTIAQRVAWNPNLKPDCSNLLLGAAYCVQGPPLTSSTTTTTAMSTKTTSTTVATSSTGSACAKTYTVVSGDYCSKIWTQFSLTETQFRALNPSLDANCALAIGQVVCLATTTATTTTTTQNTTTSTAPTTSISACATTYTVVSGDYCSKIATQFSLTDAQLRALNPSLNTNCDLSIGQVLCVVGSSGCPKTYTVVAGDYCSAIWARFGLTEAQLRGLNPGLDAGCGLRVGQVLCVMG